MLLNSAVVARVRAAIKTKERTSISRVEYVARFGRIPNHYANYTPNALLWSEWLGGGLDRLDGRTCLAVQGAPKMEGAVIMELELSVSDRGQIRGERYATDHTYLARRYVALCGYGFVLFYGDEYYNAVNACGTNTTATAIVRLAREEADLTDNAPLGVVADRLEEYHPEALALIDPRVSKRIRPMYVVLREVIAAGFVDRSCE